MRWILPTRTNVVDYRARSELHLLRVSQLFHCAGHQSKTKASSEHRTHNEPKNLSLDITKEGLSLQWNTGDQAKNDHNTIGFKKAMVTKTKLTFLV
jgi:hypothetical protein